MSLTEMRDSWRLTAQERLEIVNAWKAGEKGAQIAARYDVDDSYPSKLARSRGVARRKAATCCPHCGGKL